MPVTRPYYRTSRQLADHTGSYAAHGNGRYVKHPGFAKNPEQYVRAFLLIQKDALELFEYIEPSEQNLETYSYRIHEILLRTCVELEANCKAILQENGYATKSSDMNMSDYKLIENSHRMSSYEVKLPHWKGANGIFKPFDAWKTGAPLDWYQKYNHTKHNRSDAFHEATFEVMLGAVTGLTALIAAQFQEAFSPVSYYRSENATAYEQAVGGYFQVTYPRDWPDEERYGFEWGNLENNNDPFQKFDFNALKNQNRP